jgi:hypothetical protein
MARNKAKEDLRFITMDVRTGEVEVRDVTFPGGKRVEAISRSKPSDPVDPANYTTSGGHTRFKPGQAKVMSITDIYAAVRDIGSKGPNTLAELSVFSHGWMGGPILVDSDDDRTMEIQLPTPRGPVTVRAIPRAEILYHGEVQVPQVRFLPSEPGGVRARARRCLSQAGTCRSARDLCHL